MNEDKKNQPDKGKKTLTLNKKLPVGTDAGSVRQSFSHGRSKAVTVEVKRNRTLKSSSGFSPESSGSFSQRKKGEEKSPESLPTSSTTGSEAEHVKAGLTQAEWEVRKKVLQGALQNRDKEERAYQEKREQQKLEMEERARLLEEQEQHERAIRQKAEEKKEQQKAPPPPLKTPEAKEPEEVKTPSYEEPQPVTAMESKNVPLEDKKNEKRLSTEEDEEFEKKKVSSKKSPSGDLKRREHKLTVQDAIVLTDRDEETFTPQRSLASIRRRREKERLRQKSLSEPQKIIRDVIIPETITVADLADRMAVRSVEVIRSLLSMGIIATTQQILDADTAELIVTEFGHHFKRVSEADVEEGLMGVSDPDDSLKPRAPVVTIMGHVDHGKTSLLDAIRQTDVAVHEAGGITQHIGAYQVHLPTSNKDVITFLDTPGHAAFTAMRARGADVTDIVVLVVAADDSVMEQTIEAIHHAKAAQKPIIVAINKIDVPQADPSRVKMQLLHHELVVEELGGDIQCVELSAKKKLHIDKLEEAILLQAEILALKANPHRQAQGVVVESRIEKGHGSVATVLVQRGTLRIGDIFIAGSQWGKVRNLINDHGRFMKGVGPSVPVEVVGFNGTPEAGDSFIVVNSESQAREVAEYRARKIKNAHQATVKKTMAELFSSSQAGEKKTLAIVIKTDVQGSLEAISGAFDKFNNAEVSVKVLHGAVGGINESDIILAAASNGIVIGFNVRATQQARELSRVNGVEIRYYSIIYDIFNDVRAALSGLLAPELREEYLGTAEIRQVFAITKVGKIAGCYVREGTVRRGAKVRLLRDNIVIHEGTLKTLKRIKDEVKEVSVGLECGMAFENYQDLREGDMIECFTIKEIQRTLE